MKKQSKKPSKWSVESAAIKMVEEMEYLLIDAEDKADVRHMAEQVIQETLREAAERCRDVEFLYEAFGVDDGSDTSNACRQAAMRCYRAIRAMLGRGQK